MWSKTIFLENLYFCIWFSFVFSHGMCILCIANMLLPLSSEDECFVFQWFVLLLFDCHFIQAHFFFSHMCTVLLAAYCRMSSAIHMHGSPSWALLYVSLSAAITSPLFWGLSLQCIHSVSWWNFSGRIYTYSFEVEKVKLSRDQAGLFLVTALVPAVTRALSVKAVHVMVTKCRFLCSRFCKYNVVSIEKHPVGLQRWAVYIAEQTNSYWTFLF